MCLGVWEPLDTQNVTYHGYIKHSPSWEACFILLSREGAAFMSVKPSQGIQAQAVGRYVIPEVFEQ